MAILTQRKVFKARKRRKDYEKRRNVNANMPWYAFRLMASETGRRILNKRGVTYMLFPNSRKTI